MATTPITTDVNLDIKPELITVAVYSDTVTGKDEKGNPTTEPILRHTTSDKVIEKMEAANPEAFLFKQTIKAYKVGTISGFQELIPDADEQLNIINRGLAQKFNQKLTAVDELDKDGNPVFQPVEGTFDSIEWLQEPTQRRNLSDTEKAMRALKGLPPEVALKLLQQLASAQEA